jgi:hypothetical protein
VNTNNNQLTEKAAALAKYLGIDPSEVNRQLCDNYGLTTFDADGGEYSIGTDEECDNAARENISDSLWAFNASFVLSFCKVRGATVEKAFAKMQAELCEDANEIVRAMIGERMDDFVSQAIGSDGRGHFLSSYDGEENQRGEFFIYRNN